MDRHSRIVYQAPRTGRTPWKTLQEPSDPSMQAFGPRVHALRTCLPFDIGFHSRIRSISISQVSSLCFRNENAPSLLQGARDPRAGRNGQFLEHFWSRRHITLGLRSSSILDFFRRFLKRKQAYRKLISMIGRCLRPI